MWTKSASMLITVFMTQVLPASASDTFNIEGSKSPENENVYLHLNISSEKNLGIIKGIDEYDSGDWTISQAIPCGQSTQYFEVWSKRNFGDLPVPHIPGIPAGTLRTRFTLVGGVQSGSGITVDRTVKGTLKKKSHWKGQDFSVNISLVCK